MRKLALLTATTLAALAGMAFTATSAQAWHMWDWHNNYDARDAQTNELCPILPQAGSCSISMTNTQAIRLFGSEVCNPTFEVRFAAHLGLAQVVDRDMGACGYHAGLYPAPNHFREDVDSWAARMRPAADGGTELLIWATYQDGNGNRTHGEVHILKVTHDSALGGLKLTNTLQTDGPEVGGFWGGFGAWYTGDPNHNVRALTHGVWESADDVVITQTS